MSFPGSKNGPMSSGVDAVITLDGTTQMLTASTPGDAGPFFDPAADKPYRHPQFYKVPRGVRGL